MDTRKMKYILAIVESGCNLTKASEKLFISQPALSQILKKVESEHGVPLFDRTKKTMELTRAGHCYMKAARAIQEISVSLQQEINDEQNLMSGELHIGVTPFRATYLLPRVLASYHKKYPDINIILHQVSSTQLLKLQRDMETDISIGNFLQRQLLTSWAVCEEISTEEIVMIMSRQHPLAHEEKIEGLQQIAQELILMQHSGETMRVLIDAFFAREHFTPAHVIETTNAEFCMRLIAEGVGISLMSEAIYDDAYVKEHFSCVRFANNPPQLPTYLSYPRRKYLSAAANAFIEELKNATSAK